MAVPVTIDANIVRISDTAGGSTFVDLLVDCGSGANRGLLAFAMTDNNGKTFTSVTRNSGAQTFTDTGISVVQGIHKMQLFYLPNPVAGNIVTRANISSSGSGYTILYIPMTGCGQVTMAGTAVPGSSGVTTNALINVTCGTDDLAVFAGFSVSASSFTAGSSGSTVNYTNSSGAFGGQFGASSEAGTGTVTVGGAFDNSTWLAIAMPVHPTAALTSKFRIPTNAADGTVRTLFVWAEQTLDTLLVPGIDVTASGGFFKYADPSATLGGSFPAILSGFGASAAVDAFGAVGWATGIQE